MLSGSLITIFKCVLSNHCTLCRCVSSTATFPFAGGAASSLLTAVATCWYSTTRSPDSLSVGRVEQKSASLISDVAGDVVGVRGLNPNQKRDIFKFDSRHLQHTWFIFLCGLRGYHEYRSIWTPTLHEVLEAKQESGNAYDRFAIACTKKLPSRLTESVVGHLPKEVSMYTYYIILHGTKVTAMVMDTHHWRSPLVQGGLEIPIQVTVEVDLTKKNRQCLDKYETLVGEK